MSTTRSRTTMTKGVDHLCGLLSVGDTVDEMRVQIAAFARHVVPAFSR